jgi:putative DNA primase/helicase
MIALDPQTIAGILGGEVINRNCINAPGPGHSKSDRSLSIRIDTSRGQLIVHSHAGDDWKKCKDYVREQLGLERERVRWDQQARFAVDSSGLDTERERKKTIALKIWSQSVDPIGSIVEFYLREHRSLVLTNDIAHSVVRFHASLHFGPFSHSPGMICLLRDIVTNEPCGIHRTFLNPETGQKIDRRMLGIAKRAAIKLDAHESISANLTIGEGFETALAARLAGLNPVWSVGSKSGVGSFPILHSLKELTLLEENDAPSSQAVKKCAERYLAAGKPVNIVTPNVGNDFNDVWRASQ